MKYVLFIAILVLFGCGTKKSFTQQDHRDYEVLKSLVNSRNLEIKSDFARPLATTAFMQVANTNILGPGNTASQIDISSNANHLTIKGDSIQGYFPYFGEQQFGGNLGSNHQGIEFKDVPKDYTVTINEDKHTALVKFKINDQYRSNEQYDVFITLYPNKRCNIQVNSPKRTGIEYTGYLKALEADKPL